MPHDNSRDFLNDHRFPRSSSYDADWVLDGYYGANPLWLAEWLGEVVTLRPGMRILDLGCGRAKSSIFLAKEFGVQVWAVDLWNEPTANWQRIRKSGMEDLIIPLHANARQLPFPHDFFDAIVAFDSMQYFGTDTLFLPYIVQFLRPAGTLAFASAGLVRDFTEGVPPHLKRFWVPDAWSLQTATWWAAHWSRTGLVDLDSASTLPDGWRTWLTWAKAHGASDWYLETLEQDAGRYLGYIRIVAHRRPDTPHLVHDLHTGRPA